MSFFFYLLLTHCLCLSIVFYHRTHTNPFNKITTSLQHLVRGYYSKGQRRSTRHKKLYMHAFKKAQSWTKKGHMRILHSKSEDAHLFSLKYKSEEARDRNGTSIPKPEYTIFILKLSKR